MLQTMTAKPPIEKGLKRIKRPVIRIITPNKNKIECTGFDFFRRNNDKSIQAILNTPQMILSARPI